MQYHYGTFGRVQLPIICTHLLGDLLSLCQIIKENQKSRYGLHLAANIINVDIVLHAFPHHLENVTEAFEKFLKPV